MFYRSALSLLLLFSSQNLLRAQCPDPVASYGITGNITTICEGQAIEVDNRCDATNPVACVKEMIWDWGDGQKDVVAHYNNMTHIYDFPPQSGPCPYGTGKDFDIKLTVVYLNGDSHYQISPVKVRPKPVAIFSVPDTICISAPTVTLDNKSCYAETYQWAIQPGGFMSTAESPQYTFPSVGTYTVTLTANSPAAWGCGFDATTRKVVVLEAPKAVATATITDFCAPALLQLSSAGTTNHTKITWEISGGSWSWVGMNTNANTPNPSAVLNGAGTYTVKLIVAGAKGCNDDIVELPPIVIKSSPIAAWSGVPNSGCLQGGSFSFDPNANVTTTGGYANLTYEWTFPGGSPATFSGQNPPPVTYTQTGQFKIMLTVIGDPDPSNPCGRDVLMQEISVVSESLVAVAPSGIPANGCGPFVATFNNTSTGGTGFLWTLTANGQPAVAPTDYEFQQSTTANSPSPAILFKTAKDFVVKMEMLNVACGAQKTWEFPVKVKAAPLIEIAQPAPLCVPAAYSPALVSQDKGNDPAATIAWQFQGGTPDASSDWSPQNVQFNAPGSSAILCSITNACATSTDSVVLELLQKQAVKIDPYRDSLCKYEQPLQLTGNLQTIGFSPNAPNGLFTPQNSVDGWNTIIANNGSSDPGCATFDTAQIFVLNVDVQAGSLANFCDTIGSAQITGFFPLTNITFSGGPYVSANGLVNAEVAGFGQHTVYLDHIDPVMGCSFRDTLLFQVFGLPDAAIQGDAVGCTGIAAHFQFPLDPQGLSLSWAFGDGGTASGVAVEHTYSTEGDYTVALTAETSEGCTKTSEMPIHVESPLSINLSLDKAKACAGESVLLTCAVSGQNPKWSVFLGTFDTLENFTSGDITFPSGVEDTTYIVRAAGGNACPEVSDAVEILIHPLPNAILGASALEICSGDTVTFAAKSTGLPLTNQHFDSGHGYMSNSVPVGQPFVYFAQNDVPTVYVAVLSIENMCGKSEDMVEIVVLPETIKPFFQLSDTLFCAGDTLDISSFATDAAHPNANLQVSYQISDGQHLTTANAHAVFAQSGRYRITQWVTDGCAWDTLSRWITVKPVPLIGLSVAPDTICQGAPATLSFPSGLDAQFLTFGWQINGQTVGNGGKQLVFSWPDPGWQTVRLSVQHDTTGCTASLEKLVHVRANPRPQIAANDSIGCGKLPLQLSVSNHQAGWFHDWFFSDNTTDAGAFVQHVFEEPGLFWAKARTSDIYGCTGEALRGGLLVNPLPSPRFQLSVPQLCGVPDSVKLINQTTDALGARWFLDGLLISTKTDTTLRFSAPGAHQITLRAVNQFGCENETSRDFRAYPNLKAAAEMETSFCQSQILPLQNLSENADRWLWLFGNGASSTLENPDYQYPLPGNYTLTLIAMQDSSCADTFRLAATIEVKTSPKAGFLVRDTTSTGINDGTVVCIDTSSGAIGWRYEFPSIGQTSSSPNPVVQFTSNEPNLIVQTVFNELGCPDSDTVFFKPQDFGGLVVPNAFMPNSKNRGLHTVFKPVGVGLDAYLIEVFAPWGDRVWWSDALSGGSPTEWWDGTDKETGKELPQGAYLWQVEARLQSLSPQKPRWEGMSIAIGTAKRSVRGTVTLIR